MRKFFNLNASFLLPEGFNGSMSEALKLLAEYVLDTESQPKIKVPDSVTDDKVFDWVVQQNGRLYSSYIINEYDPHDEEDEIFEE